MTTETPPTAPVDLRHPALRMLMRKNVLAGLMFIAVAALGLYVSRNYPVGTTLRMGTGYVPRLLCWILMGLGLAIALQGLRERDEPQEPGGWARLIPVVVVTASLGAFAPVIDQLGLALAVALLVGIGALVAPGIKVWEAVAAAIVLTVLSWAIFILGLDLTIPLWPVW